MLSCCQGQKLKQVQKIQSELEYFAKCLKIQINVTQNKEKQLIEQMKSTTNKQQVAKQLISVQNNLKILVLVFESSVVLSKTWQIQSDESISAASNILYKTELFQHQDRQRVLLQITSLGYKMNLEAMDYQIAKLSIKKVMLDDIDRVIKLSESGQLLPVPANTMNFL
ncbi:Ubiquitin-conjugating_enzyme E2-binding protein [Hexamita inflata]|uniref:Ubiquitin-conjugating enzyme E2-binding protein n=1 Tax=Hexamita inflata TaxID=28002 RepID=A0AA86NFR1_9EUKA|nr:Ubiquitin-conjugating enzyme E2-binding protein [Hexamita inflata]